MTDISDADVAAFRSAYLRRQVSDNTYAGCVRAGLEAVRQRWEGEATPAPTPPADPADWFKVDPGMEPRR